MATWLPLIPALLCSGQAHADEPAGYVLVAGGRGGMVLDSVHESAHPLLLSPFGLVAPNHLRFEVGTAGVGGARLALQLSATTINGPRRRSELAQLDPERIVPSDGWFLRPGVVVGHGLGLGGVQLVALVGGGPAVFRSPLDTEVWDQILADLAIDPDRIALGVRSLGGWASASAQLEPRRGRVRPFGAVRVEAMLFPGAPTRDRVFLATEWGARVGF